LKTAVLRANLYIGAALLLSAGILLLREVSWMQTWFYCFAWWPFLLMVDSLNVRLSGKSPLAEGLSSFLFMAYVSVPVWLVFELFNLRLRNWSYINLPAARPERWLGYFLSFATVVPAVAEMAFLLAALGVRGPKIPILRGLSRRRRFSAVLGTVCLGVMLAWPHLFFPLVWLGFIFLLEPLNDLLGLPSFLADIRRSNYDRLWRWMLGGFTAGLVWEFFNFWAGTHWEYSLPYLDFWRVFQMPVFGFFGFMPFALEVFAAFILLRFLWDKLTGRPILRAAAAAVVLAFDFWVFSLIDLHTVLN
jgi:hypothetical protein